MRRRFLSSFAALNAAQFLTALNDNIFKLLLIFFMIQVMGSDKSNLILSLAGGIFVIPFLLFAPLAGTLADKYSKRKIIVIIRFIEIPLMIAAVIVIALQSAVGGYLILFLMATQSAIFSPCKYGIIPEIVEEKKISHYNGIITATTYLAIILGTFLASFLTQETGNNYVAASSVCLVIAVAGALFSLGIEKTLPQAKEKPFTVNFADIFRSLRRASQIRYLLVAILFVGYFLFMGSYVQLNIIPFAMQSLHLSDVQGGYLFLMTAIGIGIGSFVSGRLSGKEIELGFVPLATMGIMAALISLFLFSSYFYAVVCILVFLGIMGGFYVVPMDAFIQVASPSVDRGQNVAATNFIGFLGVIFASFLIAFLGQILKLSAATGFLVVGLITLIIAAILLLLMADTVLRLVVAIWARHVWHLKIVGRQNIGQNTLLIAQKGTFLDTCLVMAALPRLIRYIVPVEGKLARHHSFFYRILALLPLDREHILPLGPQAIQLIKKELALNHSVCLLHPLHIREWDKELRELLREVEVPVVPIFIEKKEGAPKVIFEKRV